MDLEMKFECALHQGDSKSFVKSLISTGPSHDIAILMYADDTNKFVPPEIPKDLPEGMAILYYAGYAHVCPAVGYCSEKNWIEFGFSRSVSDRDQNSFTLTHELTHVILPTAGYSLTFDSWWTHTVVNDMEPETVLLDGVQYQVVPHCLGCEKIYPDGNKLPPMELELKMTGEYVQAPDGKKLFKNDLSFHVTRLGYLLWHVKVDCEVKDLATGEVVRVFHGSSGSTSHQMGEQGFLWYSQGPGKYLVDCKATHQDHGVVIKSIQS